MKYRLGIDVGGTNTDAVILTPDDRVVAKTKTPVTRDVVSSIRDAVRTVLKIQSFPHSRFLTRCWGPRRSPMPLSNGND
ncbi:MAG: hydantoinase/oxoprolinase N-terminal domain-containing protein [Sulfobacillus sp.]